MTKLAAGVLRWVVDRLGLRKIARVVLWHKVPAETTTRKGWMYVFGNAAVVVFLLQILTGIALTTMYVPSTEHAYQSVEYITDEATLGWLARAMHYFGASAMVVLVAVHVGRVFLTASYKFPREMTWISGVVLGALLLAMAFTGQLLRWDEAGLWGAVVAGSFVERVPLIGGWLSELVLAGDSVGGHTLSRFFSFHVLILPGGVLLILTLHLFLVLHHGISEPPVAGKPVDPATYREEYAALLENGKTYFPYNVWREAIFVGLVFAVILGLSLTLGPHGPGDPPDPTVLRTQPEPDWFVIWYYALLFLKSRGWETFFMVYLPLVLIVLLIAMPLLANKGERSPTRRPWAVILVALAFGTVATLIVVGYRAPWAPSDAPAVTPEELSSLGPREVPEDALRGAAIFHGHGCQSCHRVLGRGGDYGPELTDVTARLSQETIAIRTLDGFGDMPAYRDRLTRADLDAILVFLRALRADDGAS